MKDDKPTIIETTSFEVVREHCTKSISEDWVVLDVDEVLLMPIDQSLRNKEAFNNKFSEVLVKFKAEKRIEGSEEEIISMMGALFAQRKAKPVNTKFISLCERLIQAIFLPSLNAFNLKIETFIKENAYEQT